MNEHWGVLVADSGMRSLQSLSDNASTSRVLNLSRTYSQFKGDVAYISRPFFHDHNLNRAMFVKHRLRRDEVYLLPDAPSIATKIIFPFDATMLRSGGRSIFVGQTGFLQTMAQLMGPETRQTKHDMDVLAILDYLPSLDPFLLKEFLARKRFEPADCYFDISTADMSRMFEFASQEVGELITLAFGGAGGGVDSPAIARLVDAMMARDAGERLDPLRATLGLSGQAFDDGVFSWKGFLYYKWQFSQVAKQLNRIMSELDLMRFEDRPSAADLEALTDQKIKLRKSIRAAARECTAILSLYDDAFRDLVDRGKAAAFRKFLIEAPRLFVDLGSSMGTISHIVSYWNHRFPQEASLSMGSDEFALVLLDFQSSLKPDDATTKKW
jgi:hypothetical protein